MIFYYSGSAGYVRGGLPLGEPEYVLGDDANLMLSYYLITNKRQDQHKRIEAIVKARKRGRDVNAKSGTVPRQA